MRYLGVVLILALAGLLNPVFAELKIHFRSDREGVWDGRLMFFMMDPDGSNIVNLTKKFGVPGPIRLSPDGTKILYYSTLGARDGIFAVDADGTNPVRLTDNPILDRDAQWSPDGTKIVWWRHRPIAGSDIFVIDADGSNQRNLGEGSTPKWSPDGTKIAFIAGFWQVPHIMNPDGSDRHDVVWVHEARNLSWSPDGTKLTFTETWGNAPDRWLIDKDGNEVADEHGRIIIENRDHTYVVNIDGTKHVSLTRHLGGNDHNIYEVAWRSDGRKIAYRLLEHIHVANSDGTNPVRLTEGHAPSWSPGPTIVFHDGGDIHSINADGSNRVNLTNGGAIYDDASWFRIDDYTPVSPQGKLFTTWGQIKAVVGGR